VPAEMSVAGICLSGGSERTNGAASSIKNANGMGKNRVSTSDVCVDNNNWHSGNAVQ
jgi:hypothetical protein